MTRVFISCPSEYEHWGSWVQRSLETFGFKVYLHAEQSSSGALPEDQITAEMDRSHIFCYIHGPHFFESKWCLQERSWFNNRMSTRIQTSPHSLDPNARQMVPIVVQKHVVPDFFDTLPNVDMTPFPEPCEEGLSVLSKRFGRVKHISTRAHQPKQVTARFEEFLSESKQFLEAPSQATTMAVREPNFLLFTRAQEFILAICDKDAHIDPHKLQRTNEPQAEATFFVGALADVGFSEGFIHPFFEDKADVVTKIFIDSSIWFQNLYFPEQSLIRLPIVENGQAAKVDVPISLFFNYLRGRHYQKVEFANITKGKWKDPLLSDLLGRVRCLTRFAPSPSHGLHFGNIRSALIPYLLFRRSVRKNAFFLRFDDTYYYTRSEELKAKINGELEWLGFRIDRQFSESSPKHQRVYILVMNMLQRCGYTKRVNGITVLDWEHPELRFGAWFDLNTGPVMFHSVPLVRNTRTGKSQTGSLELTTKEGGHGERFTYKFCGTVDDLLLSTHVVRDVGQKHSGLTSRQAMIADAIRKAWQRGEHSGGLREGQEEILSFRRDLLGDLEPPFPVYSIPLYIHVPIVRKGLKGPKLKKRAAAGPNPDVSVLPFFVDHARHTDNRLPETIISYLLSTITPTSQKSALENRKELGAMAGKLGCQALIDLVSRTLSLDWFRSSVSDVPLSIKELDCQERYILRGLTYFQFRRLILTSCNQIGIQEPPDELLRRLYLHLDQCASWKEVMAIATQPRSKVPPALLAVFLQVLKETASSPETFPAALAAKLGPNRSVRDACRTLRNAFTGLECGLPLITLGHILESELTGLLNR